MNLEFFKSDKKIGIKLLRISASIVVMFYVNDSENGKNYCSNPRLVLVWAPL